MESTAREPAAPAPRCHRVRSTIRQRTMPVTDRLLNLLFPPTCAFCLADAGSATTRLGLCDECLHRLFPQVEDACPRCGFPSPPGGRATREEGCTHCGSRRFEFDSALALGVYEGSLQSALLRMKQFRGQRLAVAVGRVVSARLGEQLAEFEADLIVPIPSPWRRRLVQGINGPGVIARQMTRVLRLPTFPQLLRWRRKVKRQHTLLPTERFRNVRGVLGLSRGYDIQGARVIVVDDILTTGATANEAARVLRNAGASQIYVAVVARVADR